MTNQTKSFKGEGKESVLKFFHVYLVRSDFPFFRSFGRVARIIFRRYDGDVCRDWSWKGVEEKIRPALGIGVCVASRLFRNRDAE